MVGEATYALPVGDVIDLKAEGARLSKEIKKLSDEVGKIDAKLGNPDFVRRAPEEVVEENRERLAGYKVPRVVEFHTQLPREDTGKIFKRRLREPYWAGQARRV